jgi:NADH-quinone oxidoreductase subunit E
MTPAELDTLIDDLAGGKLADEIPSHGVLAMVRQHIPAERGVGAVAPEEVNESPEWLNGKSAL